MQQVGFGVGVGRRQTESQSQVSGAATAYLQRVRGVPAHSEASSPTGSGLKHVQQKGRRDLNLIAGQD